MSARGGKPDLQDIVRAASRMQHRAAAAGAVRVDEIGDGAVEADVPKGVNDKTVLPRPVTLAVPVLYGATSAGAKMRADRRNALRARRYYSHEAPPVAVAGDSFDFHGFARQGARNVNGGAVVGGDSIAEVTEAVDNQALNHARPQ
jgi:hypothetical protein